MFAKRRVGDQPHPRAGVLLVVVASMAVSAPGFSFDPATGADAYRYLSAYASLGPHHRAGTTANEDAVNWLESELQSIGLATSVQSFEFERYLPQTARLSVGSFSPEVFPLYYSGRTGSSQEIQAPLVEAGPARRWISRSTRRPARSRSSRFPCLCPASRRPSGMRSARRGWLARSRW
jgi:hypothetical protein